MNRKDNLRKLLRIGAALFLLAASILPSAASAAAPRILQHQGKLYDGSGNVLGGTGTNYCFKFSIWDNPTVGSGSLLWPSVGTSTGMSVLVRGGVFSVGVGDVAQGGDLLDFDFESSENAYLNVDVAAKVGASCTNGDEVYENLRPRTRIVSSGYALNSRTVGGYAPSEAATGTKIAVLTNGNLILGGTNPQITATSTNTLTLQGGATGNIQFFGASNFITSTGTLSVAGLLQSANVNQFLTTTSSPTFIGLNFTNATGTNVRTDTLVATGISSLQGTTFTNATGTGNVAAGSLVVSGAGLFGSVSSTNITFTNATGTGNLRTNTFAATGQTSLASASSTDFESLGTLTVSSTFRVVNGPSQVQELTFTNATGTSLYLSGSNSTLFRLNQNSSSQHFAQFLDGSDIEQFRVDGSGHVFANGFIAKQMQFSEEFLRTSAAVSNDTAGGGATGLGDTFSWGVGSTGNGHVSVAPAVDSANGAMQLAVTGGTSRAGLLYLSAGSGNRNDILNATSSPIIVMKLRPTQVGTGNLVFAGMMDFTDGVVTDPANGIYFTNASGTTWVGVARSGGSQSSVTCPGQTISTSVDAYFRIEVRSSSSVEFFMDNDTSNGIDTTSCGVVTSTIPTIPMTAEIMNMIRTGGTTSASVIIDYVRLNQDDPVSPAGSAPSGGLGERADVAENIPALDAEFLEPGDVLELVSTSTITAARSSGAYSPNLYGVVPTDPGLILGSGGTSTVHVALAGRVPVKVTLENGPIRAGDWLTSASEPGRAMKASAPGMVLGRALENFEGSATGTIFMTVETQYYSGPAIITRLMDSVSDAVASVAEMASRIGEGFTRFVADELIARVASVGNLFAVKLTILPGGEIAVPGAAGELAGSAILKAGLSEVFVASAKVRKDSHIFLTPRMPTLGSLSVTEKTEGQGFKVKIPASAETDLGFDWIIFQTYGGSGAVPETTIAPPPPPSEIETPSPESPPEEATPPEEEPEKEEIEPQNESVPPPQSVPEETAINP